MTALVLGLAGAPPSAPPSGPPPTVDWTKGVVRVLGVGTPRLLSPTASLLDRDAMDLAREDAFARLGQALRGLPRPAPAAVAPSASPSASPSADPIAVAIDRAPSLAVLSEPTFFSDGTAHLVVQVSLPAVLGHPVPSAATVFARVRAPAGFQPCMQLRVEDAAGARLAGLPGDPLAHLRYADRDPAPKPAALQATSTGPCTLRVAVALGVASALEVELP